MDGDIMMFVKAALLILVIIAVIIIIGKIFQSIFFGIIVAIIVCILFTVFFGDGTGMIHYFASFMDEDVGQKIEESYDFYKEKEKETPLVDADKVSQHVSNVFEQAVEEGKNTFLAD